MTTPILQARNLTISYGDRPALCGVDITLRAGEVVALLGPNGSGKSTLIQSLFGHLRANGDIHWFEIPLLKWRTRDLARRVAYLPQSPQFQSGQTVTEVLQMGRSPYWSGFGLESGRDAEVVSKVVKQLAIEDILRRPMDELSGGQRQRVFVGRCLVQEPAALLLDEPSTYLDLKHQVELCQLLRQLSKSQSIGVLMASHDLNLASAFADRVVVMSNGKIVAAGDTGVLTEELLTAVYQVKMTRIERPEGAAVFLPNLKSIEELLRS